MPLFSLLPFSRGGVLSGRLIMAAFFALTLIAWAPARLYADGMTPVPESSVEAAASIAPANESIRPTHSPAMGHDAPLDSQEFSHAKGAGHGPSPDWWWSLPFVGLLLSIAILPLIPGVDYWWEHNRNKLALSLILAGITCLYYLFRSFGFHAQTGWPSLANLLQHSVLDEYLPFIVLLFSLYTISGGINFSGDIPAHPLVNTGFLLLGALLASFMGTTGVAMILIRPLLQINAQRERVRHTVIFFIFLVCNVGGCLLPIGDPPLFLGYLKGVPFLWTLHLFWPWLTCILSVLAVYYVWETLAYSSEGAQYIVEKEQDRKPLRLSGKRNFLLLGGVLLSVALIVPGRRIPGIGVVIPRVYLREIVMVILAYLSLRFTPRRVRQANDFNFYALAEVACLFIGIFITMQVPMEILQARGGELGLDRPWQFFWASGALSSFLDNAPTYMVYFSTASNLAPPGMETLELGATLSGKLLSIPVPLLKAISCGAVFMGAMTYIGNGPNFMVKSIAEQAKVKMPGFFGYMLYSLAVLIPVFVALTFLFFR
jgi:Na+/H+ antiporter NhaD/arsenite permease-like protein